MVYVEFLWLILLAFLSIFYLTNLAQLSLNEQLAILGALVIVTFAYTFRRKMRRRRNNSPD